MSIPLDLRTKQNNRHAKSGGRAQFLCLIAGLLLTAAAFAPTAARAQPAAPATPTAAGKSTSSFAVNWVKVSGASAYHVRWRTAAIAGGAAAGSWQGTSGTHIVLGDVATYTITGLTTEVSYDYAVRSSNGTNHSAWVQGDAAFSVWKAGTVLTVEVSDSGGAIDISPAFSPSVTSYNARTFVARTVTIKASWVGGGRVVFTEQTSSRQISLTQTTPGAVVSKSGIVADAHVPVTITFKEFNGGGPTYSIVFDSSKFPATAAPAAPTAPTADMIGAEDFRVNWTRVVGAPNYHVRWRTAATTSPVAAAGAWQNAAGEDTANAGQVLGDVITYTITGLTAGVAYDYALRTSNSFGNSAWVQGGAAISTLDPTAPPTAVSASSPTKTSFVVSWTKGTNATAYHVRWRTAATTSPVVAAGDWIPDEDGEVLGDVDTYTITDITAGTAYEYEVRGSRTAGESDWVAGAEQSTDAPSRIAGRLAAPTASDLSPTSFTINWVKDPNAVSYRVRWRTTRTADAAAGDWQDASGADTECNDNDASNDSDCGEPLGDVATYTITGLTNSTTYDYAVLGQNDINTSGWSQSATPQKTHPPTGRIVSITISNTLGGSNDYQLFPPFDPLVFKYTTNTITVANLSLAVQVSGGGTVNVVPGFSALGVALAGDGTAEAVSLHTANDPFEYQITPVGRQTYTIVFNTAEVPVPPGSSPEEKTASAESLAKAVSGSVVLSGVLDAVSQNAFDATGSFTPFVDVGAERATESRQALVPVARRAAAPLLLSEQPQGRDADWRELLGASRFRLGLTAGEFGEALGGGEWSVWGSGDVRGFNGGGDVETEGLGYSVYLGTDYKKGNWLAGIAAGYSSTTADITAEGVKTSSEFWLAGGYPYLRYSWQNQIDAWLLLGAGGGQLTLKDAEDASAFVVSHLYAAGAKANVLRAGRLSLAAKADVAANFALSVSTDNLNDFETMQQRVRVGVDAAYDYRGATHGLRPHLEVGARIDFGAGESDLIAGAEVAGGIRYEFQPLRLSIDARGRALVYDTTGLLREWGAGATIRMTPRANGEGISASLTPGWGAPQSRVDNMWQDNTPALTQSQSINQALTLRGELAYTFKHKDARITPLTQYSLNAHNQIVGLGTRLNLAPLSLELLGERIDHTTNPDDYRLRLNTSLRF